MDSIKDITKQIIRFRDERDWKQFHSPKNLAISISLEANELLEHFQWNENDEIDKYVKNKKQEIAEEMADVFNYLILMANDLDIDLLKVTEQKLKKSAEKYPIKKAKGNSNKYTIL